MANFYVKKIENASEAPTVNSATNSSDGAILKTNSQVGVFNGAGSDFYVNGQLNNAKGKVFNQNAGTNYKDIFFFCTSNVHKFSYSVTSIPFERRYSLGETFLLLLNALEKVKVSE